MGKQEQESEPGLVPVTITVPPQLLSRGRHAAASEGKTFSGWIRGLIHAGLGDAPAPEVPLGRPRKLPSLRDPNASQA